MRHVKFAACALICGLCATGAMAGSASLVMLNGKIWTENPAQPEAEAVAVEGDHILAVGSSAAMNKLAASDAKIIDLNGRRVVPGFNDSHVHFLDGGGTLVSVRLGDADSSAEFRRRIADYVKNLPKGAWVRNGNWDHQRWSPADLPTHQLIDAVTPDNPVLVWRTDGHMALANGLAMKLAGIDKNTKDVPGGEIVRDKDGNPTGILKDEATLLVERVMPPPSAAETDQMMDAALAEAARVGVTSVANMADSPVDMASAAKFREFYKYARAGKLTVRIYHAGPLRQWQELANQGVQAAFGGPLLRIGNLKAFADGALGSTTAWMQEDFTGHPGNRGFASTDLSDQEKFFGFVQGADRAGLQVSIHAIGDRADHVILDLMQRAEKEDGSKDRRFRIEHAQHLLPADAARFGQLGVVASMQPYHAIDDGRWAEQFLGPDRSKTSYAWRSILDHGGVLAFGSDWPVAPLDPITGLYAAVTRATLDGKNPKGWIPEQKLTVKEALHAYTMGSAYAEFQDKVKGSIEPGKLADLVVLSDDILYMAPEMIGKTRVVATIFGGKVIYTAP